MFGLHAKILLLIGISCGLLSSVRAQTATDTPKPPVDEKSVFTDPKVIKLLDDARTLHSKQQYFEALAKITEVETMIPDNPVLINVKGSIYSSMRDFPHARECFERAEKLVPDDMVPKFNKVELLYAETKYAEAEVAFQKLVDTSPKLREELRHLSLFKILVCQLKQDKIAEAEKTMKFFTFMDDTPAYYYSKAAFAFQKGDKDEGKNWMNKATNIFRADKTAFYIDSMMEARWVPSLQVPSSEK